MIGCINDNSHLKKKLVSPVSTGIQARHSWYEKFEKFEIFENKAIKYIYEYQKWIKFIIKGKNGGEHMLAVNHIVLLYTAAYILLVLLHNLLIYTYYARYCYIYIITYIIFSIISYKFCTLVTTWIKYFKHIK